MSVELDSLTAVTEIEDADALPLSRKDAEGNPTPMKLLGSLLKGTGGGGSGITQEQADARYWQLTEDLSEAKFGSEDLQTAIAAAATSGPTYSLPTASASVLGGVKIGSGLTIAEGVLSAAGDAGGGYTLPAATAETLGGVKVGENLTISEDGTLSATASGGGTTGVLTIVPLTGNQTLAASQAGQVLLSSDAAAVVYTIPTGLTAGTWFEVVQGGAGQIQFVGASGVTVSNYSGNSHSGGQWASVKILMLTPTSALLTGTTQ